MRESIVRGLVATLFALCGSEFAVAVNYNAQSQSYWADKESSGSSPGKTELEMYVLVEDTNEKGKVVSSHWEPTNQLWPNAKMRITAYLKPSSSHVGSPGLFFVGMTDYATYTKYLSSTGWQDFTGGVLGPYAVASEGLQATYTIPLVQDATPCSIYAGGTMIAGYGLLSNDMRVAAATIAAVQPSVTESYVVQTLVTGDMQKNERVWRILQLNCSNGDD